MPPQLRFTPSSILLRPVEQCNGFFRRITRKKCSTASHCCHCWQAQFFRSCVCCCVLRSIIFHLFRLTKTRYNLYSYPQALMEMKPTCMKTSNSGLVSKAVYELHDGKHLHQDATSAPQALKTSRGDSWNTNPDDHQARISPLPPFIDCLLPGSQAYHRRRRRHGDPFLESKSPRQLPGVSRGKPATLTC